MPVRERAMKAVLFQHFGGPEVLRIEAVPMPQPGADEVRLKMTAVGLNRTDAVQYRGKSSSPSNLPSPLGSEGAGIVEAIGPNVDASWLGRRVATLPTKLTTAYGTLAEKIVAPVDALVPCPESFSDSECSAIWLHYLTAYAGLVDIAHVGMGDVVLVNSATTNLGIASIQLAKAQWATTIAVVRDASRESELRAMGADFVLYADQDDIESQIQKITRGLGPQVVFSSFAEPLFSKAMALLKSGGTVLESQDLSEFSLDSLSA